MRYGYGAIRDQMLAATVVLPDGTLVRAGRPLVKNVAGYDLAQLFVGAQGTLGFLVDVTLKAERLTPTAPHACFSRAGFGAGPNLGRTSAQTWAGSVSAALVPSTALPGAPPA